MSSFLNVPQSQIINTERMGRQVHRAVQSVASASGAVPDTEIRVSEERDYTKPTPNKSRKKQKNPTTGGRKRRRRKSRKTKKRTNTKKRRKFTRKHR